MTYWTPEEDSELTKLAADGRTRAEIAALMMGSRTLGAVTKRARRLGLDVTGAQLGPGHASRLEARTRNEGPPRQTAEPVDRSFAFRPLADVTPVGFESLFHGSQCRWPIDYDADGIAFEMMHYCGAPVACAPYCATHHALGRVPAKSMSVPRQRVGVA